ncbi:hypothetical protein EXIGLDRAFT_691714 [Exidia glandulosa HHB12029]|uniref:Uncharacterized protein n=1 Tax=Exidia glandulosa HHB12029 TaxID=1314781 RepID=A0A165P5P0_EXIGL|nr:hypothetical protein EXIGLDRAFT_691714 [Exidia glandulosa HHB12029]
MGHKRPRSSSGNSLCTVNPPKKHKFNIKHSQLSNSIAPKSQTARARRATESASPSYARTRSPGSPVIASPRDANARGIDRLSENGDAPPLAMNSESQVFGDVDGNGQFDYTDAQRNEECAPSLSSASEWFTARCSSAPNSEPPCPSSGRASHQNTDRAGAGCVSDLGNSMSPGLAWPTPTPTAVRNAGGNALRCNCNTRPWKRICIVNNFSGSGGRVNISERE